MRNSGTWWLSPVAVSLMVATAAIALTASLGDDRFRALWGSPKSVTGAALLTMFSGALALALAAAVVGALRPLEAPVRRWPGLSQATMERMRRTSSVLVALTVVGYLGLLYLMARAGVSIGNVREAAGYGAAVPLKDVVGTLPGLTTMTQFGIAAVIVSSVVLVQQFDKVEVAKICVVVGLAIPRAFLFSERLAVLELVVPMVVVLCFGLAMVPRAARYIRLLPVVGVPGCVTVFSTFEYFRSWEFYRDTHTSFVRFSTERIAGYYATSVNNGYLEWTHMDWPGRLPRATIEFLWTAPGISQLDLYNRWTGHLPGRNGPPTDTDYDAVLSQLGNPEFNNSTGYAAPFLDYGLAGGVVYFLLVGLVAGLLYRGFREGRLLGLLLYPVVFTGLLELPRYINWAQGRSFPAWLALAALAIILTRAGRTDSDPRMAAPPRRSAPRALTTAGHSTGRVG
jgi:oligosaccharide repeat unit polymerase